MDDFSWDEFLLDWQGTHELTTISVQLICSGSHIAAYFSGCTLQSVKL